MREGPTSMKVSSHRSTAAAAGVGVASSVISASSSSATAAAATTTSSTALLLQHMMDGEADVGSGSSFKEKKLLESIDQDNAVLAEVSPPNLT